MRTNRLAYRSIRFCRKAFSFHRMCQSRDCCKTINLRSTAALGQIVMFPPELLLLNGINGMQPKSAATDAICIAKLTFGWHWLRASIISEAIYQFQSTTGRESSLGSELKFNKLCKGWLADVGICSNPHCCSVF